MAGWTPEGSYAWLLAVGATAALGAAVLASFAVAALRAGLRRLAAHLEEIRRHPLVGEVPPDMDPALKGVTGALNGLLADLRERHGESARRSVAFETIASGPPDIALIGADPDWRVLTFSRGAVTLTGWPVEEIVERHLEILFAPGEWERVLPKLARRSLRDAGIVETVKLQRRDGAIFPAQASFASGGGDGSQAALLMVARDLTAQQEIEERLAASEARYRQLVEGIADGAFVVQADRLMYANPALAGLVGAEPARLIGAPFADLIDAADLLGALDVVRGAEAGGEGRGEFGCRLRGRGRPGPEVRIAWAAATYQGRRAIAGTVIDVTARARFERTLAESQARLKATLDGSADGILVLEGGPQGRAVTLVNPAFCRMFSVDAGWLRRAGEEELRRLLGGRVTEPKGLEDFLREPGGDEARLEGVEIAPPNRAIVDLLAAPVRLAGERIGTILTARDVTRRLDDERQVRRSVEELSTAKAALESANRDLSEAQGAVARRNEQLEALNAELKSLDEMKSNLLANVSHELHTPLVSIKGYSEMILKRKLGPLTPEQERGLGVALKNIDRLIEMIDNLLSFSRLEKGETQLHLENLPLWQLIDEAVEMVGERVRRKNLAVTTQYETDELMVRGDRVKIGQVLTNLLTNAVKFNRDGGAITVTVRPGSRGFLEVDVADTGIGIPADALGRIFERFYQVDGSPRRSYEGTGIGLSIVRDILRLHGCAIRVTSEVGKGSVFTFTLPMARDQEPSAARQGTSRGRTRG